MEFDTIQEGDCLELIKSVPNACVDCVITDPPYGDDSGYGRGGKEILGNQNPLLNLQFLSELWRVLKDHRTVYNFTNWRHLPFIMNFVEKYTLFNVNHVLVWKKGQFGFGQSFRNQYELILVLEKRNGRFYKNNMSDVLESQRIKHDDTTHPHFKPVNLILNLLEHSTKEGEVVLDPFVGSGSIPVACKLSGRKFIGFELASLWANHAQKRVEATLKQEKLTLEEFKNGRETTVEGFDKSVSGREEASDTQRDLSGHTEIESGDQGSVEPIDQTE